MILFYPRNFERERCRGTFHIESIWCTSERLLELLPAAREDASQVQSVSPDGCLFPHSIHLLLMPCAECRPSVMMTSQA